jgi:hypothetical protein
MIKSSARRASLFVALALVGTVALAAPASAVKVPATFKPNRVVVQYVKPVNAAHEPIYQQLTDRRILERLQAYLSPLRLPTELHLRTAGCEGESNAWYEEDIQSTPSRCATSIWRACCATRRISRRRLV